MSQVCTPEMLDTMRQAEEVAEALCLAFKVAAEVQESVNGWRHRKVIYEGFEIVGEEVQLSGTEFYSGSSDPLFFCFPLEWLLLSWGELKKNLGALFLEHKEEAERRKAEEEEQRKVERERAERAQLENLVRKYGVPETQ